MKVLSIFALLMLSCFSATANAYAMPSEQRVLECDRVMVTANSVITHLKSQLTSALELRKDMNGHLVGAHKAKQQAKSGQTSTDKANQACGLLMSSLKDDAEESSSSSNKVMSTISTSNKLDARGFEFGLLLEKAAYYARALTR